MALQVPDAELWKDIGKGFSDRWNFPGCYGAIDGKHIRIQAPANSGSEYYNYQHTSSIVLMAVVDHDYCFRYIDVGSFGRNADGGIFQRCSLYPVLENGSLIPYEGFLVGDDAFPLKPYLLKPFSGNNLSYEEKVFNYRLSRARRIVENGFGILASRFRVFGKPIDLKVETTEIMVNTACTLHNWLRISSPHTYTPPGSVDYEDTVTGCVKPGSWRSEISELPSVVRSRNNNRAKAIAEKLRQRYKDYFVGDGAVLWQRNMVS